MKSHVDIKSVDGVDKKSLFILFCRYVTIKLEWLEFTLDFPVLASP